MFGYIPVFNIDGALKVVLMLDLLQRNQLTTWAAIYEYPSLIYFLKLRKLLWLSAWSWQPSE